MYTRNKFGSEVGRSRRPRPFIVSLHQCTKPTFEPFQDDWKDSKDSKEQVLCACQAGKVAGEEAVLGEQSFLGTVDNQM